MLCFIFNEAKCKSREMLVFKTAMSLLFFERAGRSGGTRPALRPGTPCWCAVLAGCRGASRLPFYSTANRNTRMWDWSFRPGEVTLPCPWARPTGSPRHERARAGNSYERTFPGLLLPATGARAQKATPHNMRKAPDPRAPSLPAAHGNPNEAEKTLSTTSPSSFTSQAKGIKRSCQTQMKV